MKKSKNQKNLKKLPLPIFCQYLNANTQWLWDSGKRNAYKLANSNCLWNKKAVLSQRWPRDARYRPRPISRSWSVAEIRPIEIIQDGGAILNLFKSKIAPLDPPSLKTPLYNQTWSGSDDQLRKYGHLKFFQDGGGRHLGFVRTGNSAIRSAVPENFTLEQNMTWIGRRSTGCGDIATWNFSNMAVAAIMNLFES